MTKMGFSVENMTQAHPHSVFDRIFQSHSQDTIMAETNSTNTTAPTVPVVNPTSIEVAAQTASTVKVAAAVVPFTVPTMDITEMRLHVLITWLRIYYTPCVIALGVVGNMISILALLRTRIATLSAARYLAACAIVDCFYLLNLLITWLVDMGYPVFTIGIACHATTFMGRACAFLSVWYTVSYSVDMLIAIKYPNAERHMCTTFKAKLVCLVLAVIATVVFFNTSLLVAVRNYGMHQMCLPVKGFERVHRLLGEMDVFVNVALPTTALVAICVTCAVQCYRDGLCQRRGPHRPPQRSVHVECDVEAGVRKLYFTFVITHLTLNIPLKLTETVFTIRRMVSSPQHQTLKSVLAADLAACIYNAKFASNFFVFLLAWKGFRCTLLVHARRRWRRLLSTCNSAVDVHDVSAGVGHHDVSFMDCGMDDSGIALCSRQKLMRVGMSGKS